MTTNQTDSILAKICADKLKHIEKQKSNIPQSEIEQKAQQAEPCRGFINALKTKISNNQNALIAEVKKASPSKGVIREDFNPTEIAKSYESGGAACVSVLTDVEYFQGCDHNLELVKSACSLPALRKDFILDVYQVYEARALGADCILLIMAALSDDKAKELEDIAIELGMDVLVEVHDEEELQRALKLQSKLVGINNRNLKTLAVDIATTANLSGMIPEGYVIVCESGIASHDDIIQVNKSGVYSFLVGESLMLQEDIEKATRALLGTV